MIELFPNTPQYIRDLAKYWVDLALKQKNIFEGVKMVSDFANTCINEEDKEFVDFYFKLRLEQLRNESSND